MGRKEVLAERKALELLENDFECVTFRGFPMDIRNLREAGIESCDAVVAGRTHQRH